MMHENAGPLVEAYKAIEGLLEEIEAYVKVHEYYLYLVDHPFRYTCNYSSNYRSGICPFSIIH